MKKVLILFGGNSYEHEISCKSVNFIINNIDDKSFDYKVVGINYDNNFYEIRTNKAIDKNWMNNPIQKVNNIIEYIKDFDVVFPIIHGNFGEDGRLQGLLDFCNVKYIGCNSYSSFICYDKILTKLFLEKYSIPQVPYKIYNSNLNLNDIEFPVIVKPSKCGSSIGINVCYNKRQLKKAIKIAQKFDKNIIIENFICNKCELECSVLMKNNNIIISNIGEIMNNGDWYDYNSKYKKNTETGIYNEHNGIEKKIKIYSKYIFKLLSCNSLSRVDFLYDINNNKLYFNEINTMPGLTDISMYPKLLNSIGINNKDLINILLNS